MDWSLFRDVLEDEICGRRSNFVYIAKAYRTRQLGGLKEEDRRKPKKLKKSHHVQREKPVLGLNLKTDND